MVYCVFVGCIIIMLIYLGKVVELFLFSLFKDFDLLKI